MSVTLSSKSREVREDSVNLMASDNRSKEGWRSHVSVWWIGAAAVCLGFLLLVLILGLVAHNSKALGHQDSKCDPNLIYSLTVDRDTLRDERDQLTMKAINLTREMEVLQTQYNAMAVSRDALQEEVNRVNLSRKEPCHPGWKTFRDKYYYFSSPGVTKTWENSRKDCQERRADLVIITTREEMDFVVKSSPRTWIGLSDKDREGVWKWVDGTDMLSDIFWDEYEPNNSNSNEHCAEVSRSKKAFNDAYCGNRLSWACEF